MTTPHPLTNFEDIIAFHEKYGLNYDGPPRIPHQDLLHFRVKFQTEELEEFIEAWGDGDLPKMADALIDMVYVAMGTAYLMGLPWQALWNQVQAANMRKVRAEHAHESKRGSAYDVIKPEGWVGPDIEGVLMSYTESFRRPLDAVKEEPVTQSDSELIKKIYWLIGRSDPTDGDLRGAALQVADLIEKDRPELAQEMGDQLGWALPLFTNVPL